MITVMLYGDLGKKFGAKKSCQVRSISEIFKIMECNGHKIRKYLFDKSKDNVFYRIFINDIAANDYSVFKRLIPLNAVVKIIPIPMGQGGLLSGSGRGTSFLAIGLGALFIAGGGLLLATGGASAVGLPLLFAGVSLLATGVIGLLSPQPQFQADQLAKTSFLFDGILDTARQGAPVPIVYGRLLVQGITVNSSITTEDTDGTGTGFDACGNSNDSIILPDEGN